MLANLEAFYFQQNILFTADFSTYRPEPAWDKDFRGMQEFACDPVRDADR
jgi:hypothetical protein